MRQILLHSRPGRKKENIGLGLEAVVYLLLEVTGVERECPLPPPPPPLDMLETLDTLGMAS